MALGLLAAPPELSWAELDIESWVADRAGGCEDKAEDSNEVPPEDTMVEAAFVFPAELLKEEI